MRFIEVFEPEDLRRWFAGGYHRGIFDNNVIQNVTEMVKSGLSNISDTLNLKKNWLDYLPYLMSAVAAVFPELSPALPMIE